MRPIFDLFSLGDHSITLQTGSRSDLAANRKIASVAQYLSAQSINEFLDIIPAYNSITIIYNVYAIRKMGVKSAKNWVEAVLLDAWERAEPLKKASIPVQQVPVCYEEPYCMDRKLLEQSMAMSWEEIITLHCSKVYQVCMVGYMPGFPSLGILPDAFERVRKETRRLSIPKGSVGVMGNQSGIFPITANQQQMNFSGIWSILGKSPLPLIDFSNGTALLSVGNQVQFYPITTLELNSYNVSIDY